MPTAMMGKATILLLAASLFETAYPALAGDVAEPAGYRMEDYRAPVPDALRGARVVTTAEAETLWRDKTAVFFDVMPKTPKPANLPAGTIWRDAVRTDIAGSVWLPNVGYGAITEETAAYFRNGLAAHAPAKTDPILFYCMTDCWMSWNAAKRALEWGYTSVIWYPGGADGWEKAGLPVAEAKPFDEAAQKLLQ
ncbi:PQQ-dependent catabolism-associated CXXCW motif protein [Mesorhizobium albiziae]|uniref:PQQ-dependent catabolism-associated CXXCW motif protein n=1 Tax=Neomesorhizobium albiziae TaxID=335020 RepID=A0A1I3VMA2_9HYPH|nr:PQQ-dependent catabolism-associated CXXCW motif protein [Mesorhizobium albiziae]GLS29027.1 rhodanese domain-containing protein [Mesorhizobium albiziae]SFJ96290.1 PQQ-dependent catabolism-associated CXXCW motif protein [Mesorhizobium albiziae]